MVVSTGRRPAVHGAGFEPTVREHASNPLTEKEARFDRFRETGRQPAVHGARSASGEQQLPYPLGGPAVPGGGEGQCVATGDPVGLSGERGLGAACLRHQ